MTVWLLLIFFFSFCCWEKRKLRPPQDFFFPRICSKIVDGRTPAKNSLQVIIEKFTVLSRIQILNKWAWKECMYWDCGITVMSAAFIKRSFLWPTPRVSESVKWVWELTFHTSSKVVAMLLVWGPHYRYNYARVLPCHISLGLRFYCSGYCLFSRWF